MNDKRKKTKTNEREQVHKNDQLCQNIFDLDAWQGEGDFPSLLKMALFFSHGSAVTNFTVVSHQNKKNAGR